MNKKLLTMLYLIIIIPFPYILFAYGENTMHPMYRLNKAAMKKLDPQIYSTKKSKIEGMFSVPIDNTIATNKIGNAITLIHFNENKIKYETVKRNFLDYVSSGYDGYMSIFSEDTIGYSIGRGFLLFNLKNKSYNYYSIAGHFNYKVSQIIALDPDKKNFLFKIRDVSYKQPTFIRLIDLSSDSAKVLKEKEVGDCGISVRDNSIFVYHDNEIYAMNHQLEHVDHPLLDVFNRERKNISGYMYELRIHPTLPFAIIKEQKRLETGILVTTVWSLTWREDIEKNRPKMVKILSEKSFGYKFSYDGKWLWFIDSSTSPRSLILMPVDPDLPYFIGKPIYLGEVPRPENANGDAMTRNPSGFVMSECEGYKGQCWLKKWDFTEAEKLIEKNK
jgi:hypothetical protein